MTTDAPDRTCVECCVDLDAEEPGAFRCASCGGLMCWVCNEWEMHEPACSDASERAEATCS
jgi:hypothetical protein